MCPKFCTNPVLKYTQCHISTDLSNFLKLCLLYCQKLFDLLQKIADLLKKIGLVGALMPPDRDAFFATFDMWSKKVKSCLLSNITPKYQKESTIGIEMLSIKIGIVLEGDLSLGAIIMHGFAFGKINREFIR